MKIGILTQPLNANYGGILQNFALAEVLKSLGHQPITIDRHRFRPNSIIRDLGKMAYRIAKPQFHSAYLSERQKNILADHQHKFIEKYIAKTIRIDSQDKFDKEVSGNHYDAFIVGSDQCWRPCYSANISNFFLDFAVSNKDIRKIAYAASFGVDNWEFNDEQTRIASESLQEFDGISVREKSGIDLCRKYLNSKAAWVLDPTMLAGRQVFDKFIDTKDDSGKYITTYLLEESNEAKYLVNRISENLSIADIRNNQPSQIIKRGSDWKRHKYIPVEEWISNIANADFVVTDSFHGAVFSILYNTPFIVKLNMVRGNTRIESLLEDFGLQQCLVSSSEEIKIPVIDWNRVNDHLSIRQQESLQFLDNSLA